MADIFTKKKRSQIMARIKGRGTAVEILVAGILRELGFKPDLHRIDLPGSPDLVLSRHKVVIFTNGCFWHSHRNCPRATLPTTNMKFWAAKISGNRRRDERQRRLLRKMGWKVITFWTCKRATREMVLSRLARIGIRSD
jgi:DNA mismatch endonuclease, patch repair protein